MNYLILRRSGYYFRKVIPVRLRPVFNVQEVMVTLSTHCKLQATQRAMPFLFALNEAITFTRSHINDYELKSLNDTVHAWLLEAKDRLHNDVVAFPKLLNAATKLVQKATIIAPKSTRSQLNASSELEYYFDHKKLTGEWRGRTAIESIPPFHLFLEIVGDKEITEYTRDDARYYREVLLQMPSSRKKRATYRSKSIHELLNMDIPDEHLLRKKTVNSHLILISSCFKWFTSEGKVPANVFEGLQVKESDSISYKPYTMDELRKLFELDVYTNANYRFKKSYKYWSPLLGLYTGARLNELCQLRLSDIGQDASGIWFIDINDEDDRSTKSNSSNRRTPIHSLLLTLGFIEYVKTLKSSGHSMLFPDLKRGAQSWKDNASKTFASMAKSAGIKQDRTKCFHSFRKNAVDAIAINAPKDSVVSAIVGHKQIGMTFSRYFSEYPLEELQQAIDLIDYGLDLSKLRDEWRRFVT